MTDILFLTHKPENSKWHCRRGQTLDNWILSHTNLPLEALCSLNLGWGVQPVYKDTLSWRCIKVPQLRISSTERLLEEETRIIYT